jgi:hypothetical protein
MFFTAILLVAIALAMFLLGVVFSLTVLRRLIMDDSSG